MALEVKNLVKTYGDYTAVNNLSFSIDIEYSTTDNGEAELQTNLNKDYTRLRI